MPVTPTEEFRACLSYPCHATSTCIDLPSTTFVCICRPNYTGLLCDEEINKRDYEVPSFDGKSYVRMSRLKAYHKFSIEVEFKTYADNGIILYNQQKSDGTGDFVSLAIVDGSVPVNNCTDPGHGAPAWPLSHMAADIGCAAGVPSKLFQFNPKSVETHFLMLLCSLLI